LFLWLVGLISQLKGKVGVYTATEAPEMQVDAEAGTLAAFGVHKVCIQDEGTA